MTFRLILLDVPLDDMILAVRAYKWLHERTCKDAILVYGDGREQREFYAKRNKSSITVRPVGRDTSNNLLAIMELERAAAQAVVDKEN